MRHTNNNSGNFVYFLYFREAIINKAYDFPGQGRYYFIVLTPLLVILYTACNIFLNY